MNAKRTDDRDDALQRDDAAQRDFDYHYRRTDSWHFEKRLSLDTVVSVVSVVVFLGGPILFWGRAMEGRVQALEVIQDQRMKQEVARDMDARDQRISILTRMDKIDEQVTQLRIELGKLPGATRANAATR
jgi:hypothetical protein